MTELEYQGGEREQGKDTYTSTAYSNSITCGICGAPVRNVPVMYERMSIDWRCAKCLRRDKPVLDDRA